MELKKKVIEEYEKNKIEISEELLRKMLKVAESCGRMQGRIEASLEKIKSDLEEFV